jgi:hypothetical protein
VPILCWNAIVVLLLTVELQNTLLDGRKTHGCGKVVSMSSIAIFDATSNSNNVYGTTQATPVGAKQEVTRTTPAATTSKDTVTLSAAAQAKVLHQSGQSVASIASSLGTDTKTVDEYLGITVSNAINEALKAATAAKS